MSTLDWDHQYVLNLTAKYMLSPIEMDDFEPDVVSLSVSWFHVPPLCSCSSAFGPTLLELSGTSSSLRCAEMQTEVQ